MNSLEVRTAIFLRSSWRICFVAFLTWAVGVLGAKTEIKFGSGETATTSREWASYSGWAGKNTVKEGIAADLDDAMGTIVLGTGECANPCAGQESSCSAETQPLLPQLESFLKVGAEVHVASDVCMKMADTFLDTGKHKAIANFLTGGTVKLATGQCWAKGEGGLPLSQAQKDKLGAGNNNSILFSAPSGSKICVRKGGNFQGQQLAQLKGSSGTDPIVKPANDECIVTKSDQGFPQKMLDFLRRTDKSKQGGVKLHSSQCVPGGTAELPRNMAKLFINRDQKSEDGVALDMSANHQQCLAYNGSFPPKFIEYLSPDNPTNGNLKVADLQCLRGKDDSKFPAKMESFLGTIATKVETIQVNLGHPSGTKLNQIFGDFKKGTTLANSLGNFDAQNDLYSTLGPAFTGKNSLSDVLGNLNSRSTLKDRLGKLDTGLDGLRTTIVEEQQDIDDLQKFFEVLLIALLVLLLLSFLLLFLAVRMIRAEEQAVSSFNTLERFQSTSSRGDDQFAQNIAAQIRASLQQPAAFGQARTPGGVVPGGVLGGQTPLN